MQKIKWLSEEALKVAVKKQVNSKGEKERYKHLDVEFKTKFRGLFYTLYCRVIHYWKTKKKKKPFHRKEKDQEYMQEDKEWIDL